MLYSEFPYSIEVKKIYETNVHDWYFKANVFIRFRISTSCRKFSGFTHPHSSETAYTTAGYTQAHTCMASNLHQKHYVSEALAV